MKFCTFETDKKELKIGFYTSVDRVTAIEGFTGMKDLIKYCSIEGNELDKLLNKAGKIFYIKNIKLKAPILDPGKMIFVGLNYREHAAESNLPIPEKPILFAKFSNSLVGHEEDVIITSETKECDYEAELAFIIGKTAKKVTEEKAMDYVFGYTICNDVSARELQLKEGGQWLRGKAIDTFAPMGPFIVTADEVPDPHILSISSLVNGEVRQKSNTDELIFKIPQLLSFLSQTITLEPGDIVSTGTPSGVAAGMEKPAWLKPGDICEVKIEKIGTLMNKMVADKA